MNFIPSVCIFVRIPDNLNVYDVSEETFSANTISDEIECCSKKDYKINEKPVDVSHSSITSSSEDANKSNVDETVDGSITQLNGVTSTVGDTSCPVDSDDKDDVDYDVFIFILPSIFF